MIYLNKPINSASQLRPKLFQAITLITIWIIVNSYALYHFGIVTGFEAQKYITNAESLLYNEKFTSPQFLFYSTQIFIIALAKATSTYPYLPIVVQLLANAYATFCLFKIIALVNGNKMVAFYATAYLLGMFYYQLYNTHLFTESLYFSLSIIYFYQLIKINTLCLSSVSAVTFLLTLLYLTRPVGLFFIPATFIFLVLKFIPKKSKLIFSTAGILFIFLFVLLLNNSLNAGGEFDFLLPYLDERVICGVPTLSTPHKISMPVEKDSVQGLVYIITHYWNLFISLSSKRFIAFWGVVRPYYSIAHNLYVGIYFYSLYLLIILGVRKWSKSLKPEIFFMWCLIVLTTISTVLSCDEWHNRFIFSILPFLVIMATFPFRQIPK